MKEITVSLVDAERALHVKTHEGFSDVAIGALSAEPETIEELLAATGRFVEPHVIDAFMTHEKKGIAKQSDADEQVIIDLPGRLLVNATASPEVPRIGTITHCDEHAIYDLILPYRLPDDWLQTKDINHWQPVAEKRRHERSALLSHDARAVLFGRVADYLVREWQSSACKMDKPVAEIHDKWLLTPREDLLGKTPRELLLAKRDFIDGDIQDQGELWTLLERQPLGLSPRSTAYRFGSFGTHEIIFYHELVALLLFECESRMRCADDVDLSAEIRHLEQLQQEWLHQPAEDLYSQSPAAMIARERSRLPAVLPDGNEHLHDDCPLCQMMAKDDRPAIWHMDNWMLCSRFATSFCATIEEWREEYGDWKWDDDSWQQPPFASPGFASPGFASPGFASPDSASPEVERVPLQKQSVWQSSFTNMPALKDMPPDEAITAMVFSVGGHLAELGLDLRASAETGSLYSTLQSQFAQLHEAVQERKIWSVNMDVARFAEQLQAVGEKRADLRAKCSDLEEKLDALAERCQRQFGSGQGAVS